MRLAHGSSSAAPEGGVTVASRDDIEHCPYWRRAFAGARKDHRYYELVEDTICPEFEYRYFVIRDGAGEVRAVQPFFITGQDLLAGAPGRVAELASELRRFWPGFMRVRTLMVGCAAGEGHLDPLAEGERFEPMRLLAHEINRHARSLGARLVVLKEFPARYRARLACFAEHGFVRVPSLPMTQLNIAYGSFDEYMAKALNSDARRKLRKKLDASAGVPIELTVRQDLAPIIDEVYPLYLQVYERSKLRFEKLSKAYLIELGRRVGDKVRFFVWRSHGGAIAFSVCMLQGDSFFAEYVGFDYRVALDLHLYHYAVRDMMSWAMQNRFAWFRSSPLNYDPKLHLRHRLDPVDLYVRHTSDVANLALRRLLPFIEPVQYDKTLPKFPNYQDLWAKL